MAEVKVGQLATLACGRVGIVKFVGNTSFAPGEWAGVELEGPLGKNDGSVSGVKYFACKPLHGVFVKAATIKVADNTLPVDPSNQGPPPNATLPVDSQPTVAKYEHRDGQGNWHAFDEETNVLIAEAERRGDPSILLPEVLSNPPDCRRFEIRFGNNATSTRMPKPSPTCICQVNLVNNNTRQVRQKTSMKVSDFMTSAQSSVVASPLLSKTSKVATKNKSAVEVPMQKAAKKSSIVTKSKSVCVSKDDVPPPPLPRPEKPMKLFTAEENLGDKLVGVVVTISSGNSYDPMFKEVKPTTVPGERVSTYSVSCAAVAALHAYLKDYPSILASLPFPCRMNLSRYLDDEGMWINIVQDIAQVPADSVVFNWECCSGCGDNPFPCCASNRRVSGRQKPNTRDPSSTMSFMGYAVRSGWTVMCSDFSLKSLLLEWSEEQLGPNPFTQMGTCSGSCCLEFLPSELQNDDVPQQLQVVGELCKEQGKAVIQCMGSTITYTVNPQRKQTEVYGLKVLTIATDMCCDGRTPNPRDRVDMACAIGEGDLVRNGFAGHVTLTYNGGGQLITSMGHWIELSRIDTSVESVLRVAGRNFGGEEVEKFRQEYASKACESSRYECVQKYAKEMVSKSAPSRMKKRTKFECSSSGYGDEF